MLLYFLQGLLLSQFHYCFSDRFRKEKNITMGKLISKIPDGPLAQKWTKYKASVKLVNPANKKKLEVIVIGTGLSGAGASSTLGELGYKVKTFCYQDSPRRAHSVAAQGGINAAKNYQ